MWTAEILRIFKSQFCAELIHSSLDGTWTLKTFATIQNERFYVIKVAQKPY